MVDSKDPVCSGRFIPVAAIMPASPGKRILPAVVSEGYPLFLWLFWAALLTASRPLPAQPKTFEALPAYFEQHLPQWLEDYHVPGVSLALIREAQPQWIATFGQADAGRQDGLTPQTVFQAASLAKPLTAWGVMKLVSEGRIDLDEPVNRYLTRWQLSAGRYDSRQVTVRRLLSHTSGLNSPPVPHNYDPATRLSPEALLSGASGGPPPPELKSAPGSSFHYSNAGYTILQLLISEVSGRSFSDYMYGAVLAPLGMQKSSFRWENVPPEQRATAHDFLGRPAPSEFFPELAATGLSTTAADLAYFVSAGMPSLRSAVRGYPVLPPQAIEQMQLPQATVGGNAYLGVEHYGLGYFVETTSRGFQVSSHSGYNPPGWTAHFFAVPKTGDGLVVLTNGANGRLLINAIAQAWSRATGIGRLAITSAHRKVTAIVWLATLAAGTLALGLGLQFLRSLRRGRRGLSRKHAFIRLFGLLLLAGGLAFSWVNLPLLLHSWTPKSTKFLVWALSAAIGLAMLTLLLPRKEPEEWIKSNKTPDEDAPPVTEEQADEPEN